MATVRMQYKWPELHVIYLIPKKAKNALTFTISLKYPSQLDTNVKDPNIIFRDSCKKPFLRQV
jgi:hypothetical protein